MKFSVERTVRFTNLLAKGSHIRLNDMIDSNNGIYTVVDMTGQQLELMNTKTNKGLIIKATDDLSRYTFDVGSMQFVPSENKSVKEKASENKPMNTNIVIDGIPMEDFLKRFKAKII